jgi:hypothetical protein
VGVREYAQTDDLVGHPGELIFAVGVCEADEQQESALDPASHAGLDSYFGTRYALE